MQPNIEQNCIPKKMLTHGEYYAGTCRNACIARWNADEQCFWHWRTKFGNTFLEKIKHPEDEPKYDVFFPVVYLGNALPQAIEFDK
jgi:hypothetical protein